MYGLYNDAKYSHILKNLSDLYGRMYKQVSLTYNLSEGTLLSPKLILLSQIWSTCGCYFPRTNFSML